MAIKFLSLPFTEHGAKLEFDDANELRVVYCPSERNLDFYEYNGLWNPDEEYPDDYVALPFKSVYGGIIDVPRGKCFTNVEGSAHDPKHGYHSWLDLMKKYLTGYESCCAETDKIYNSENNEEVAEFHCTNGGEDPDTIVGAHVLLGETRSNRALIGSNVALLPLCTAHNVYNRRPYNHGTGYYMKLRRDQQAIILRNYFQAKTICDALKEEAEMNNIQNVEKLQLTETEVNKPELSIGLEFMFMGVDLSAYYMKKQNGYQIFVAPISVDNNVSVSLQDMINQFNNMAGKNVLTKEEVEEKINQSSDNENLESFNIESVKFCLKMLFLNIDSETKTTEYAFSLQIIADGLIPKNVKVFNIKSLSFNIWNTQRKTVLDKMALTTPASFF